MKVDRLPYDRNFVNFAMDSLRSLNKADRARVHYAMSTLLPGKVVRDDRVVAGIISAIVLRIVLLTDYAQTAGNVREFRLAVNRWISKYSKLPAHDFDQAFDKWDESVGGFQYFIEKRTGNTAHHEIT